MIESLALKNFTAFDDVVLEFSPKINVVIGENATGKTHLLKAAYALCGAATKVNGGSADKDECETKMTDWLLRLFLPLNNGLGKLHRQGATGKALMSASFHQGGKFELSFAKNSRKVSLHKIPSFNGKNPGLPVFVPTKEPISFMEGFVSLYDKYEVSFDQTYQDISLLLDLPRLRPENVHEKSKWAMEEIERVVGGRFIFHGGGRVTFQAGQIEYSANAMAEGWRKIGMLSRLIETGAIQPGISGPLFWDEPEGNLNPMLLELLVRILLELSRIGQQIILTTHDYVLLKCFDLLMDVGKGDHVRFHSLYRDQDTAEIRAASTDDYMAIKQNQIDEAFGKLINLQIQKPWGA